MNQRLLIALIILAGIGSIGSVLAYSGSISAAQGNFNNVLVTGTCTGCGGGDGNFNSWSLVQDFNGSSPEQTPFNGYVSNSGTVYSQQSNTNIVFLNGTKTELSSSSSIDLNGFTQHVFSSTGEYGAIQFTNGTGSYINVFKNDAVKFTFKIDSNKFFTPSSAVWEISPNGKYISLAGKDKCNCGNLRVQTWQGS